jgi:hypothetical protein
MASETQTTKTPAHESVADISSTARWLLTATMAFETMLVLGLACRDFTLAATPVATMGAVLLLAISGICFWAAYAICAKDRSWFWASLLGQFAIGVLAVYTLLADIRSPLPSITVGIITCIPGVIAIFWVAYLLRQRSAPRPKWATTIAALIPLVGFVQFWLQTDYLPRTSMPLVDVTADLTPTGKMGDKVQLEAKVTFNNRGSVPVSVGGTVMRITAYPQASKATPDQLADAIQFGLKQSSPYRDESLPSDKRTLYANDLLPIAEVMAPGQSTTYRKVVNFDSSTLRLARLDVDGIFITSPNIDEVYTCPVPPDKTWWHVDPQDPKGTHTPVQGQVPEHNGGQFQTEVSQPIYEKVDGYGPKKFLCREIRLKPRNVVYDLIGDHPRFEVMAIFDDPTNQSNEYPALLLWLGDNGNYSLTSGQWQKVLNANPTISYKNIGAEYIPSEQSALPGAGTPSTTQPPSTNQPP